MGKHQRRTLNARERLFVAAFLKGEGMMASAIAAGYAESGAASLATRMMKRPHVKAAIEEFYKREEPEIKVEREILRRRLFKRANIKASVLFEDDGRTPKPIHQIPEEYQGAIRSMRVWNNSEEGSGSSAKFADDLRAAELYFKHFPESDTGGLDLEAEAQSVDTMLDDIARHFAAEEEEADQADDEEP